MLRLIVGLVLSFSLLFVSYAQMGVHALPTGQDTPASYQSVDGSSLQSVTAAYNDTQKNDTKKIDLGNKLNHAHHHLCDYSADLHQTYAAVYFNGAQIHLPRDAQALTSHVCDPLLKPPTQA